MLVCVQIKNFRNFEDWFEFDLRTTKNYEFSSFAVQNGVVKHAIIYGLNGGGKSNLGLAMLDLTCHLNDMSSNSSFSSLSSNYLNANSRNDVAEFKYQFEFDGVEVVYSYGKKDVSTLVYERLDIDGETCISIDRRKSALATYAIQGAEHLKNDLSDSPISALKYLSANAILEDTNAGIAFKKLISFVKGMVFFRTLNKRSEHLGVEFEISRLSKEIINSGHLADFEAFLNESGIECRLKKAGPKDDERIEFVFDGRNVEFSLAASSGTQSLGVFYFWWLKLKKGALSFAYIDEFDAFYHHALAKEIVKKLSALEDCQTVLTTHNTGIMSNDLLRPDCYFEVRANVSQQKNFGSDHKHEKPGMYPFFSLVDKELRKAHNLEKIYKGLTNG